MSLKLTIDYPETIPDALQETRDEFERHAKIAMFAKLYELKRVSSGMAASILGIERVEFLLLLHQYQVPMIDIPEDELASDVINA
jgi:predicted HTH domain antitoxin